MANKSSFNDLSIKFAALSSREKNLVLISGLAVLGMILFFLLIEPLLIDTAAAEKRVVAKQKELIAESQKIADIQQALSQDPDDELKKQLASLEQRNAELDADLSAQTASLVEATQMPKLLEKVLNNRSGLKLIEMESITPTPLVDFDEMEGEQFNLYQHGVRLILEGRYFDIQRYLEEVESSRWKFYWKRFDYKVQEYPAAQVELELFTLSTNPAFIGV